MKHFQKYLVFTLITALSCDSDDHQPIDTGTGYTPYSVGMYSTYAVDETTYSDDGTSVIIHYELMTHVIDSFPASGSVYTYVIHRSTRSTELDPWVYKDTWSARVDDLKALTILENTSYVTMTFPVQEDKSWDGNEFNTQGADSYLMQAIGQPYTAGEEVFPKTLYVEQENTEDLLLKDHRFEVFAHDIGLIAKETIDLEYCDDIDCFGQKEIKRGVIYKQSILTHGSF